jgi:hypothetical protein
MVFDIVSRSQSEVGVVGVAMNAGGKEMNRDM